MKYGLVFAFISSDWYSVYLAVWYTVLTALDGVRVPEWEAWIFPDAADSVITIALFGALAEAILSLLKASKRSLRGT